jgi:hypothetical protein
MVRNIVLSVTSLFLLTAFVSCVMQEEGNTKGTTAGSKVKLMILNPGHYHAALVQKSMYDQVAPDAYVYAPDGPEVHEYLKRIESFNDRSEDPTSWREEVYAGYDYFEPVGVKKFMPDTIISKRCSPKNPVMLLYYPATIRRKQCTSNPQSMPD